MASNSEVEKILEAAVAGIPRVAEAVASIPEEDRPRALDAVEGSYRQTVRDLGYEEGPVQSWVSAVMLRLQKEVKAQASAKQKTLEVLHEEPVQAETGPDSNVRHG
jgi:Mg/Co/Ni transporter MgtE